MQSFKDRLLKASEKYRQQRLEQEEKKRIEKEKELNRNKRIVIDILKEIVEHFEEIPNCIKIEKYYNIKKEFRETFLHHIDKLGLVYKFHDDGDYGENIFDKKLQLWLKAQKRLYRQNKLKPYRKRLLDKLNKNWNLKIAEKWWKHAKQVKYIHEVENRFTTKEDGFLHQWCVNQRQNKRKGILNSYQIEYLNSIKNWSWNINNTKKEKRLNELEGWVLNNNKIPSKESDDPIEKSLGHFCNDFRKKGKKDLSHDIVERLEGLEGWYWSQDEKWWEYAKQVKYIHEVENRFTTKEDGFLHQWCVNQRQNKRKGILNSYQIEYLNSIKNWSWNNLISRWDIQYEILYTIFINNKNKLPKINSDFVVDGYNLKHFIQRQKQSYKKGTICLKRKLKLKKIGIDISKDIKDDWVYAWGLKYKEVWHFRNNYGIFPTKKYDISLCNWCKDQRKARKKGVLKKWQIRALDQLGDWKW